MALYSQNLLLNFYQGTLRIMVESFFRSGGKLWSVKSRNSVQIFHHIPVRSMMYFQYIPTPMCNIDGMNKFIIEWIRICLSCSLVPLDCLVGHLNLGFYHFSQPLCGHLEIPVCLLPSRLFQSNTTEQLIVRLHSKLMVYLQCSKIILQPIFSWAVR